MQDMIGGRIDYMCEVVTTISRSSWRHDQGVAMFDSKRSKALPDLRPRRARHQDLIAYTWNAIFLSQGAPDAIVKKLTARCWKQCSSAVKDRLSSLGAEIRGHLRRRSKPRHSRQDETRSGRSRSQAAAFGGLRPERRAGRGSSPPLLRQHHFN